jgi:hypothetical protein
MSKEKEVVASYREVKRDYEWDPSVFNDEPERVARIKEIIDTRLTQVDKIIFIMYCECGSLRKLGKLLGFSYVTMSKEVKRIRQIILDEYNKYNKTK